MQYNCIVFINCLFTLQYYTTTGLPSRKLEPGVCAVCGNKLLVTNNDEAIVEKTYKLSCDHVYPFCSWFKNIYTTYFSVGSSDVLKVFVCVVTCVIILPALT